MNNQILPMFPLQLVVFECEEVRLHIFEPRYKKLIAESVENSTQFGIPVLINNKLQGTGAVLNVVRIEKRYPSGEMDIVCKALQRFEIIDFMASANQMNAASAVIESLPFVDNEDKELNLRITDLINGLIRIQKLDYGSLESSKFQFYLWVHKTGMGLEKELEMVHLQSTYERQLYMLEHLKTIFNSQEEMVRMKKMIQLNGHFKKLNQSF